MERALQLRLLSELLELIDHGLPSRFDSDALLPVKVYTSMEQLRAEQQVLFRQLPLIVGNTSELKEPGDYLTHDASGVPLLIVRGKDGIARAFLNVCRHRGTRLVTEAHGNARAFVCRYHAWSYETNGTLLRVPHREYFPSLCEETSGLCQVPLAERCGFLWVVPGGRGGELDIDSYLGPLAAELSSFGLAEHSVHHQAVGHRQANWKLVMDAFLEGYHVRSLHHDTISRFFLESAHMASFPPHSRSLGARKELLRAREQPQETWDLRALTTPFYCLFPNTILVFHPDWVSMLSLYPAGLDRVLYCHRMLIPGPAKTEEERHHWDKTFQLIDGNVFQRQDFTIAESIQLSFAAGADTHFRLGRTETPIKWFHDQIAQRLSA
jgi:phenylpropionate dioxygenase-like ring-hydroxylating dioxygenase large terminal subunit